MVRSWLEISLSRIVHNLEIIRSLLPREVSVIAVVKANAYGHGAIPVSRALSQAGISSFAVACLDEALELRDILPSSTEIIVFGGLEDGRSELYRKWDITASVFDDTPLPPDIKVHAEIDTGMGRLGFDWKTFRDVFSPENKQLTGLFSHFPSAEVSDDFTREQIRRFEAAVKGYPGRKHISNSAGLRFPEAHMDAVRPGLALYGIAPCPELREVKPAMRWRARILSVRDLPKGAAVGYGGTFITCRQSRIGILPVGYADGYNRLLSSRGSVRLDNGSIVPVVGIVSMDLLAIDLTDYPGVLKGDVVTLLEADSESILSARSIAKKTGTIPYEVLTSIGSRVERRFIDF
jgi:alanine racemase